MHNNTHVQVCSVWTSRPVVVGEELLWNFPPSAGYVYEEFDPKVTPVQLFGSSVRDLAIPNIGIEKVAVKSKGKTDCQIYCVAISNACRTFLFLLEYSSGTLRSPVLLRLQLLTMLAIKIIRSREINLNPTLAASREGAMGSY